MTKKMPALFAKNPPKKGQFHTLDDIVDDWIFRFGEEGVSKHMRDEVVDYCMEAGSWQEAVIRACKSRRPNGKMHNHQSRVPENVRELFNYRIMKEEEMLMTAQNFDELHDALDTIKPFGIGPVTLYDIATRIAAYMKLEPTSLYLHAGVREGWKCLYGKRSPDGERIPKAQLPKPLQRIPCDQVEDMLCAYREYLKPELIGG
jgi:hypothetical protein